MSLDNGDNFTKATGDVESVSSLFSDAYQFPKPTDNMKIEEGKYEKISKLCDPYWDMVLASERLRRQAAGNGAIERMVNVLDALHDCTNCGDFAGGRPQALQQALRGIDGSDQQTLTRLEDLLRTTMQTKERGVKLSLTKDQDGRVHLNLSRTVEGSTYNIDVTGTSSIATVKTTEKTYSIGARQAFDNILPLTHPPRRDEN